MMAGYKALMNIKVWVSYPLKQGLKPHGKGIIHVLKVKVWVSYPLKQGLKPRKNNHKEYGKSRLSQLSIKTRIETPHTHTRESGYNHVWVSYPLKQGLKLPPAIIILAIVIAFESAIH